MFKFLQCFDMTAKQPVMQMLTGKTQTKNWNSKTTKPKT